MQYRFLNIHWGYVRRVRSVLWLPPVAVLLFFTFFFSVNTFSGNIHTVVPGQWYRSAQLSPVTLEDVIQHYGICTVLNLRRPDVRAAWYRDEIAMSIKHHVNHIDMPIPAHGLPSPEQLRALIAVMQSAPQPVLLHCRQGADRSGLASAIAVMLTSPHRSVQSMDAAKRQISWYYNVVSTKSVGYQVFYAYGRWLADQHITHNIDHFMDWTHVRLAHA